MHVSPLAQANSIAAPTDDIASNVRNGCSLRRAADSGAIVCAKRHHRSLGSQCAMRWSKL